MEIFYPDWRQYFSINKIENNNICEEFRKKFPNVFKEDFTKSIKDYVADIVLEDNATPIFCSPYSVAYGIRDKVDAEIDRLIANGILTFSIAGGHHLW